MLSDPSRPSDYCQWGNEDAEEARLQEQVVPGQEQEGQWENITWLEKLGMSVEVTDTVNIINSPLEVEKNLAHLK